MALVVVLVLHRRARADRIARLCRDHRCGGHGEPQHAALAGVGPGASGSEEFDFESPAFNTEKWFQSVVRNKANSIQRLVQTSNELDSEVKNLDSELQMIVYENYSKFIRATDTINQMNQ